jgi:hypothetical protein
MELNGCAIAVLADLALLGLKIRLDKHDLKIKPKSKLSLGMVLRVRAHKEQIMEVLRQQPAEPAVDPDRYKRYVALRESLIKRGYQVLADKPEVVLALMHNIERHGPQAEEDLICAAARTDQIIYPRAWRLDY